MGETRDGKILGFHNWIQFYLQEKAGNVDYQGYVRHGKVTRNSPEELLKYYYYSSI